MDNNYRTIQETQEGREVQSQDKSYSSIWVSNPRLKMLLVILIFVFLGSGIGLVILSQVGKSYREKIYLETQSSLPKHKEPVYSIFTDKNYGYEVEYPSSWVLKQNPDSSLEIYPKDLYNPNYANDYVLRIESQVSISSVFEQGEKSGCRLFVNTFVSGLPAKMCEETGLHLNSTYYRITNTSHTLWGKFNMISYSIPNKNLDIQTEYEKIISKLAINTKAFSQEEKANWKKYENKDFGFELKYPEKYGQYTLSLKTENIKEANSEPMFSINFVGTPSILPFQDMVVPEFMMDFEVRKGQKLESWLNGVRSNSNYSVSSFEKELVNDAEFTTYTVTEKNLSTDFWAVWEAGDNFYLYACNLNKFGSFCKDILSTIKTPNPFTGWKTYRNDIHDFELKYPSNAQIGNKKSSHNLGSFGEEVYGIDLLGGTLVALSDQVLKTKAESIIKAMTSFQDIPDSEEMEIMPVNCEAQDIKNQNVVINAVYCVGEGGPAYYAYIKGAKVDFFFDGYPALDFNINEVNKVLSTFKFTIQLDTSTWRIYKNEEYGFELMIPDFWFAEKQGDEIKFISPETDQWNDINCKNDNPCASELDTADLYFTDKEINTTEEVFSKSFVKFGNYEWLKYKVADIGDPWHYQVKKAGKIFDFKTTRDPDLNFIEKVLSTFKITKN